MLRYLRKSFLFLFILSLFVCSFTVYNPQAKKQEITLTKIGFYEIRGTLFDIHIVNDIAYASEYSQNNFYIINVSNPYMPTTLDKYSIGLPHSFDVEDSVVYIAAWDQGLKVINVSDPTNPLEISEYDPGTVGDVIVEEDIAFAGRLYGLDIVNVSNPSTPEKITTICDDMGVHGSFFQNNFIYSLAWNWTTELDWIIVYDISDIMNPIKLGEFEIGSSSADIFVEDDIAFIANEYNGVLMVNFSDFSNPSILYTYDDVGSASSLKIRNNILYLANGYTGVELLDITNKTNPTVLAEHFDGGQSESIELQENLIYVGDSGDGLEILQIEGLEIESTSGFGLSSILLLNLYLVITVIRKRKNRISFA